MRYPISISVCIAGIAALLAAGSAGAEQTQVRLTLKESIDRALAENLDIQSSALGLKSDQWEIRRQQAAFDPALSGTVSYENSTSPNYTSYIPVSSIESDASDLSLSLSKKLSTGATVGLGYSTALSKSNIETENYTGGFRLTLTQPLLNGFGKKVAEADLYTARLTGEMTELDLRDTAASLVYSVESGYWNLVYANEALDVARMAVARAESLLAYNETELRIGMKTDSDVLETRSSLISLRQDVIDAEANVRDLENELGRLLNISASGMDADARIVPLDTPRMEEMDISFDRLFEQTLAHRPDYLSAQTALRKAKLQQDVAKNGLRPSLDLSASYKLSGADSTYGGSFDAIREGNTNGWAVGLTLSYPLGNRASEAVYEKTSVAAEKARIAVKNLEQGIAAELRSAIRDVETERSRIDAMTLAIEVNQQKLNKEMERYRRNMSTSYLVLEYQTDLADAMRQYGKALVDYNIAVAKLRQLSGSILDGMRITVLEGNS